MGSVKDKECLVDTIDQQPSNGISVLVVGSGIGGLTTARELQRIGCDVRIFERRQGPVLTGDSFSIGASALKSLHRYPRLQKEVFAQGSQPSVMVYTLDGTAVRGPIGFKDLLSSSIDGDLVSKILRLSRPKLYSSMLEHLQRLGLEVEYSKDVVDYFEDVTTQKAGVVLRDGSKETADLVVAADGAGGHSWKVVLGQEVPAKPSGDAIFRSSFPAQCTDASPTVAKAFQLGSDGQPAMCIYFGSEIQIYVLRAKDEIQWSIIHKDDGRAKESWDFNPSVESVLGLLESYPEVTENIKELVRMTPPTRLIDWRIMWRDPQPKWTSSGGLVVQLGDAGHTFHPSSGNGGTQAMEEGVSLAACIAQAEKLNLGLATRVHNLLRFERVSCLQAFGIASQADRKNHRALPKIGKWIVLHDPEQYARDNYAKALSHIQNDTPFQNTNTPKGMKYHPWTIDSLLEAKGKGEPTVLDGDWS